MGLLSELLGKKYEKITAAVAQDRAPAAMHLPVENVRNQASRLVKGREIIAIWRSGARSAQAAAALAALGRQVSSVKGGMHGWKRAGGKVVARKDREGTVI